MARVTVEDCIMKVPNRFELVLVASQRVNEISTGAPLTVEKDNDKNSVISLREIADETVSIDSLKEGMIRSFQAHREEDEEERVAVDALAEEKNWLEGQEGANIAEEIAEDVLTVVDDLEASETESSSEEVVSPEEAEGMDV